MKIDPKIVSPVSERLKRIDQRDNASRGQRLTSPQEPLLFSLKKATLRQKKRHFAKKASIRPKASDCQKSVCSPKKCHFAKKKRQFDQKRQFAKKTSVHKKSVTSPKSSVCQKSIIFLRSNTFLAKWRIFRLKWSGPCGGITHWRSDRSK